MLTGVTSDVQVSDRGHCELDLPDAYRGHFRCPQSMDSTSFTIAALLFQ